MNELSHDLLSPIEAQTPRNEWDEINRAAQMIAEGMVLENIAGSTEDRVALVFELDSLFNAYAPHITVEEKPFLISVIEAPVAAKATTLLRQQIESGSVTNDLVHKIRDVPFGINVLASDLNLFVEDAVTKQKSTFGVDSKREREDKQYQADVIAKVAANYGLNIPAIASILPSGGEFKTEQVNRLLREINQKQDKEIRKTERAALGAFVVAGYARQVKDFETLPSRMANQFSSLFESRTNKFSRVVTTAALLGVAGPTLSVTAAHAAPPLVSSDNYKGPSDLTHETTDRGALKPVMAKVARQSISQSAEAVKEVAKVQQNTGDNAESNQKNDKPKVVAKVGLRKEAEPPKPTSSVARPDQGGRLVVVASPGVRTVPQKPQTPPSIRKSEDGHAIIIAKTDESRKERLNIVKVPLPNSSPQAPIPETITTAPAPAPEQQAGPYVLNAEQNAIIDSLNLSPAKKDFLKQAAAGALGLQQHGSKVNPEVVIAQAALESGWGQSELTLQAKNYFGMKAGTDWRGKTISMPTEEVINGSRITENAVWPVFDSAEDCFAEYAKFIERLPHFADALEHSNDPAAYVAALVNGPLKYATDPEYEAKIMGTIKANRLSELVGISHKVHDEKVAADAAAEAQKVAAAKAAEEAAAKKVQTISQTKKELAPVTALHLPVPEGSGVSPQYAGHKGIDFAVPAGTPFYAAMGGTVEVRKFDVTNERFCKDAFANLGRSVNEIKPEDRVQQEVRITRVIDGRTYVTIYAHMDRIDVETGQIVEAGEALGVTGNTGCSTGDHAHFEMQVDNMGSVAPNLLFDGEKWKAPSSIVPWSVSIKPQSAEADHDHTEEGHVHAQSADISNDAGVLKIDHSTEPAEISGSAPANDADDKALKEESPQIQNIPSVEQTVSQAIEKARRAAEISSAALERARSNDKALVK